MTLTDFGSLVAVERERQIMTERWTAKHDDDHEEGELAMAGAAYAVHHTQVQITHPDWDDGESFPWTSWDKRDKHDTRRALVIAAALIWAEYDRICRAKE